MSDSRDVEILPAPTDATSAVAWSSTDPDIFASANWNGSVKTFSASQSKETSAFQHPGPVLDVCFPGPAGPAARVYSGGLDRNLRELDLETNKQNILTTHSDAIRCLKWSQTGAVISASWDQTLKLSDPRAAPTSQPIIANLPSKAYSLDALDHRILVATGKKHIVVFDDRNMAEPEQRRDSSLKYMTRSIRISPDNSAFALTSIEGRVAVDFFDLSEEVQKKKYAFKCHRQNVNDVDTVYPVNALAFHPQHGTFATGGGDAVVSIWDLSAKKRLRQYPKYAGSIWSLAFNCDGTRLAVASSVMEEEGTASASKNALYVRSVGDDCKPKGK